MRTVDFLNHLKTLSIQVRVEGERLICDAPKGALTPELQASLREHKEQIISLLSHINPTHPVQLGPINPGSSTDSVALSAAQQRMWLLEQLAPGSSTYHIPAAFRIHGHLDIAVLEQSLTEIIRRHDILRTTVVAGKNGPVQSIAPTMSHDLAVIDLQAEDDIHSLLSQVSTQPFNLAVGPLLRTRLWKLESEDFIFLVTMHHLISDGWSFTLFWRELETLYTAYLQNEKSPLTALPIQYADYAIWQQKWLEGEHLPQMLNYWQQQLIAPIEAVQLPVDYPGHADSDYQGASYAVIVSPEVTEALKALSRATNVTLFMSLLSMFNVWLYSYSQQSQLLVCSPVAGRHQAETENLIGYFNNIVVFRSDLTGNPTFRELLPRIRQMVLDAYNHQDVPFQHIAALPDLKRISLSRVLFDLQDAAGWSLHLPQLRTAPINIDSETADFDLSLLMEDAGNHLVGSLRYKIGLFKPETIATMWADFETLLTAAVNNPDQPLSNLFPAHSKISTSKGTEAAESQLHAAQQAVSAAVADPVLPTNGLELKLTAIWEDTLGVSPIGVEDNFFDLGGHSLLAVTLATEIEHRLTGQSFPLALLLQAPTIRQLATALRDDNGSEAWSALVPIQPGGRNRPIFFVHAAGGNVLLYYDLAKHLGPNQPVYGLQSQGLDGNQSILTTAEEMAALYIKEIRAVQPEGPYLLGGYCLGGTIAYEMAQQLCAQGQKVDILALFETYNWAKLQPETVVDKIVFLGQKIDFHTRGFLQLSAREKRTFFREKLKVLKDRTQVWRGQWHQIMGKTSTPQNTYHIRLAQLWKVNDDAGDAYQPRSYPGQIIHFRAVKEYKLYQAPALSWEPLAAGGVKSHLLPAYPSATLVEPFVVHVATILSDYLETANR